MAGRVVLLASTHRVAPGLLSFPAWDALRAAERVVTREADHPQRPFVEAAGARVEVLESTTDAALAAMLARTTGSVVLLGGADGDPGLAVALASALVPLAEQGAVPEVEVLAASWDLPGARLLDLVAIMDRLRSPGGCPWDAEQTHDSLVRYLLEETYETVEAIETGDLVGLREELGDLLLQVVFHARIGEEHAESPWSVDDVAGGIVDKLVRRHPHVFARNPAADPDAGVAVTAEDVESGWEQLKAAEKGRTSALEGVPATLPALMLADALVGRAAKHGVVAPTPSLPPELTMPPDGPALGELLLGLVAAARAAGLDAEQALRAAARRYADRVRQAEAAG